MRLASLAVVASLLLAVAPSVAEYVAPDTYEVTHDDSYEDHIEINDTAFAKAGWWQGEHGIDGGYAVNLSDDGVSHGEKRTMHWMWINDSRDDYETSPVTVEVETQGAVVAAVDVFRVQQEGKHITPDCPQHFAEELYPGADRTSWLFRVLHETTNFHQRTGVGESMEVELFPEDSRDGYLVAIYPQAGSGSEQVETTAGDARIDYEVSFNDPNDDMIVTTDQGWKAPERPFHTGQWFREPGINPLVECVEKGIALPDELTQAQVSELPGDGPTEDRVSSMLETHLG